MLTLKQIRDDKEAAIRKLAKKGVDAAPVIEKIETLDDRRKAIQVELDNTLAAQNKAAKEIGALMGQGRREEAEERKRFVADLKEKSNRLQAETREVQDRHAAQLPRRDRPGGQNRRGQPRRKTRRKLHRTARKPAAPLGAGPQIRHHRLRSGREAHGRRIPRLQGQGRTPAAGADQLLPRLQHQSRLSRSRAADHGQRGFGLRHRTAPR